MSDKNTQKDNLNFSLETNTIQDVQNRIERINKVFKPVQEERKEDNDG